MPKMTAVVFACVLSLAIAVIGNFAAPMAIVNSAPAVITISNFQFTPKTLTVKAGATVTWTNKEGTHTVTADDNSWESPNLSAGQTFTHLFTKPGSYPYHCSFHGSPGGNMSGTIKVVR